MIHVVTYDIVNGSSVSRLVMAWQLRYELTLPDLAPLELASFMLSDGYVTSEPQMVLVNGLKWATELSEDRYPPTMVGVEVEFGGEEWAGHYDQNSRKGRLDSAIGASSIASIPLRRGSTVEALRATIPTIADLVRTDELEIFRLLVSAPSENWTQAFHRLVMFREDLVQAGIGLREGRRFESELKRVYEEVVQRSA